MNKKKRLDKMILFYILSKIISIMKGSINAE